MVENYYILAENTAFPFTEVWATAKAILWWRIRRTRSPDETLKIRLQKSVTVIGHFASAGALEWYTTSDKGKSYTTDVRVRDNARFSSQHFHPSLRTVPNSFAPPAFNGTNIEAGALPTTCRVPAAGRSGHHTNLPTVPEGFSDRLVRHADRWHEERPRLVTGQFQGVLRKDGARIRLHRRDSLHPHTTSERPQIRCIHPRRRRRRIGRFGQRRRDFFVFFVVRVFACLYSSI